jgi:hypothetical protein
MGFDSHRPLQIAVYKALKPNGFGAFALWVGGIGRFVNRQAAL